MAVKGGEMYEKMKSPSIDTKRITTILFDYQIELSLEDVLLLEYLQSVAQFRLAIMQKKEETSCVLENLEEKEKALKRVGFLEQDLRALNVFVRDTYQTEAKLKQLIIWTLTRLKGEKG